MFLPRLQRKDANPNLVHRDFALELKAVDEDGSLEGYASVWGVRDSYNEEVMPGAFVESLARQRREGNWPLMLWQHNPDEPIGVWEDLAEDKKGLWGKGKLLKGVRRAEEAHIMLKAGALRGLSIGYREVDVEPARDSTPRRLLKVDLFEISVVSFPANRRAVIDTVKADGIGERFEKLARQVRDGEGAPPSVFEELLRDAGFPKSLATGIASRGWAAVQRESDGQGADNEAIRSALAATSKALGDFKLPTLG